MNILAHVFFVLALYFLGLQILERPVTDPDAHRAAWYLLGGILILGFFYAGLRRRRASRGNER